MSENTSPANESAPVAAQPAANNQDNASENKSNSVTEATSTESKSDQSKSAKKEPKQGVRDTRTNKTPENADHSQADAKPVDKSDNTKDEGQPQQNNQQNNSNNNRSRGRRGRKANEPNQNQNQSQQQAIKLDAKAVSKKAWKIFLAEVGEEGLALIGDKEGKELTKRSFRLGEIFQEEEQRRIKRSKKEDNCVDINSNAEPTKKKPARAKKATKQNKKAEKTDSKESTIKTDVGIQEDGQAPLDLTPSVEVESEVDKAE